MRSTLSAVCTFVRNGPRAASAIVRASSKNRSTLKTSGSGAHCFVFLLISSAVPVPQFGWHPHFIVPQSAPVPEIKSVTSDTAPAADSGNQSRSGSVAPVWVLTSSAKCDSV